VVVAFVVVVVVLVLVLVLESILAIIGLWSSRKRQP
jgi:hypothetical protein